MYKCSDCGQTFEEPHTIYDKVPYGDTTADYPGASVCPHCGSDFYDEVEKCKMCDEYTDNFYGLCPECFEQVSNQMKSLIDKLKEYNVDLDILDDLIERNC